uniref:Uncharacterized protein n=1 Tax=Schizaphis graminum TaxID=13262 RepID=A0A2S2NIB0_SCHGA
MDTRFTIQNLKHVLVEDDKEKVSKNNKQLSIINAFSQQPTINQGIIAKGFPKRKYIYRKTLTNKIPTIAINMNESLKNKLTSIAVKYVCVTTDGWSVYKSSYIGMTVHWFNYETLL